MASKKQVHAAQAASEGAEAGEKVEFLGEHFRLSDEVGYMPLMKFAYYAEQAEQGLIGPATAAMYAMLKDTIHADDWDAFERHAIESKARGDDFAAVAAKCMEILTARPTRSPSGSSSTSSQASGS